MYGLPFPQVSIPHQPPALDYMLTGVFRLKCDRQSPCTSCLKRGGPESCSFANSPRDRVKQIKGSKASEAQLRLQKLEDMVTTLMEDRNPGSGSPIEMLSSQLSKASTAGHLDVQGSESNYVGATHWTSILENVYVCPILNIPCTDKNT